MINFHNVSQNCFLITQHCYFRVRTGCGIHTYPKPYPHATPRVFFPLTMITLYYNPLKRKLLLPSRFEILHSCIKFAKDRSVSGLKQTSKNGPRISQPLKSYMSSTRPGITVNSAVSGELANKSPPFFIFASCGLKNAERHESSGFQSQIFKHTDT